MKKPKVDHNLCPGDQVCVVIAPDVFELNEEGLAYVVARARGSMVYSQLLKFEHVMGGF